MDRTETTIALDNLERQALPAAEDVIIKYFKKRGFDVADWTEAEYKGMIEACVLTWKARYATLCELHDNPPF